MEKIINMRISRPDIRFFTFNQYTKQAQYDDAIKNQQNLIL